MLLGRLTSFGQTRLAVIDGDTVVITTVETITVANIRFAKCDSVADENKYLTELLTIKDSILLVADQMLIAKDSINFDLTKIVNTEKSKAEIYQTEIDRQTEIINKQKKKFTFTCIGGIVLLILALL